MILYTMKQVINKSKKGFCRKDERSSIFDHLHHCIQYQNSNINNNFKVHKRCARDELFQNQCSLKKKKQN